MTTLAELPVEAPTTVEELVEVVRRAAVDGEVLVPAGRGSPLAGYASPDRVDRVVSTQNLSGILSHEPDDGTLSALAGTTMGELRTAARAGGHFLTPDVSVPAQRTLGGVLAAGRSGPDRLRFGPARDHVLGARVLLADGTVAKSGGQLVKNVTGYDLHRLYCGSHGTLCILLDAALRLFPEPEEERLVSVRGIGIDEAFVRADRARGAGVRSVSLLAEYPSREHCTLHARLFGKRAAVEHEQHLLQESWEEVEVLQGAGARTAAETLRDALPEASEEPWIRIAGTPASLSARAPWLAPTLGQLPMVFRFGVAEIDVFAGTLEPRQLAATTRSLREDYGELTVTLANAPAETLAEVRPFPDPGPGLALMQQLKRTLDPVGLLATGRFHPGL